MSVRATANANDIVYYYSFDKYKFNEQLDKLSPQELQQMSVDIQSVQCSPQDISGIMEEINRRMQAKGQQNVGVQQRQRQAVRQSQPQFAFSATPNKNGQGQAPNNIATAAYTQQYVEYTPQRAAPMSIQLPGSANAPQDNGIQLIRRMLDDYDRNGSLGDFIGDARVQDVHSAINTLSFLQSQLKKQLNGDATPAKNRQNAVGNQQAHQYAIIQLCQKAVDHYGENTLANFMNRLTSEQLESIRVYMYNKPELMHIDHETREFIRAAAHDIIQQRVMNKPKPNKQRPHGGGAPPPRGPPRGPPGRQNIGGYGYVDASGNYYNQYGDGYDA